ncbi:amidohydrolase family protein [Rhodococcoides kyotonense]|uniref:Predicted amidohydrolase YtcJ n=1 Tax=Rhodococcoides kyotonense TaxID=398843 RepID=A0A239M2L9_9NOCA|nr:amidohydrolase family protein [Rhodococcus kyotonensis]SNT36358.1 Predicted amidohydrolase YtcJ [Rhodococcus kyotonensis]
MNASVWIVRDAEVDGVANTDIRIDNGRIAEVGHGLPSKGMPVVDADGCAVIPGLTDHHIHLHAMAAAEKSVQCGPPDVSDFDDLAQALASAPVDRDGWIRGIGYAESVAGALDRFALDKMQPNRKVRIQHRSGALWMMNTLAAENIDLAGSTLIGVERDSEGAANGRLWRADGWLRERLPHAQPPNLREVGRTLSLFGITSVTDATPDLSMQTVESLSKAVDSREIPQRVHILGAPLGFVDGDAKGLVKAGPYKIVLGDSDLPDYDQLVDRIETVHRAGRPVAVHCVSAAALVLLLAALEHAGPLTGDRIEHASIVPVDCVPTLRRMGVRIVTQPGFIADRGDRYLREVDGRDHADLYRCNSLLQAAVPVALSSDAPYGPLDPWAVIVAAMRRRTQSGSILGPSERVSAAAALDAYLGPAHDPGGHPSRLTVGRPADFVVLSAPIEEILASPGADAVRETYVGGIRA